MNIPSIIRKHGKNCLIMGAGGGFDAFAGLPIWYELYTENNCYPCFASYADSNKYIIKEVKLEEDGLDYYPEYMLALPDERKSYSIGRHGTQLVLDAYKQIVAENNIDTLITVDGGVDSLMKGDEENAGTILEDFICMAAADELDVPNKYHVCLGFGAEAEEDLNHYRALENISELMKEHALIGTCSLTPQSESFQYYKTLCEGAWKVGRISHVQSRIIPAVEGEFGDSESLSKTHSRVHGSENNKAFLSPLMSIYWFFEFDKVAKQKGKLLQEMKKANTFTDAMMIFRNFRPKIDRSKEPIPL